MTFCAAHAVQWKEVDNNTGGMNPHHNELCENCPGQRIWMRPTLKHWSREAIIPQFFRQLRPGELSGFQCSPLLRIFHGPIWLQPKPMAYNIILFIFLPVQHMNLRRRGGSRQQQHHADPLQYYAMQNELQKWNLKNIDFSMGFCVVVVMGCFMWFRGRLALLCG